MKTAVVCVLWCVVVLVAGAALAGEAPAGGDTGQQVESKITQVTVYGDRALVRRVATLTLRPGEYDFVFKGLPRGLDDDSLRAAGMGTAQARLLGLESKVAYTKETPEERVQKLRDEVQALEDQIQVVTDELAVLAEQQDFITQMKLQAQTVAAQAFQFKDVNVAEWDTIVAHVGEKLNELMKAAREKNIALRELKKDLAIKQGELGRIKGERVIETKDVTVSVEVIGDGTLELALDYAVRGATWQPLYDARADVDKGAVDLTYYGTVSQQTGEDWTDVKLVLSTAQPAVGAQVPELEPWYLGGRAGLGEAEEELDKSRAERGLVFVTEGVIEHAGGDAEAAAAPMEHATAAVVARGTSVVYEIPKVETIPSDGEPHRTTIGIVKLTGAMRYTVVPKLVESAFLQTEVKNTGALHLLGGPVHVFLGPDFIGQAQIKTVVPDETFELSLGADARLKVKREVLKDMTKVSKVRNRASVRNTIKITLENFTGKTASVVVKDQVPVSREADIKVKLIEATDRIAPNEATGELEWKFDLAQGAKRELTFEFEFSYPKEAVPIVVESLAAEGIELPAAAMEF